MSHTREHAATLIKYIGMSFITGAIAHGFFTGTRQILTALFGVVCFVIGTYMEEGVDKKHSIVLTTALLAIGIGAVTGGLQHFPDSPERSVWIVPIGYILTLVFFERVHGKKIDRKYALISTLGVSVLTILLYFIVENGLFGTTHSHADQPETIVYEVPIEHTGSEIHDSVESHINTDIRDHSH